MSIAGNCNRVFARSRPCCAVFAAGFTLLELLVVMVLIALAGALTLPKLQFFLQGDSLQTSARKTIGFVQQSAQLARQEQRRYVLRYEGKEHILVAEPLAAAGTQVSQAGQVAQSAGRGRNLHLPQGVRLLDIRAKNRDQHRQQEPPRLYISGKGYAEPALITLAAEDGGAQLSLVISPFLGRIEVVEGYVDLAAAGLFR